MTNLATLSAAIDRLAAEVAAGRLTQAEATAIAEAVKADILSGPPVVVPPAATKVDTGISNLQHVVDAIVREDGLSRSSAFELIAERGLDTFAATLAAEKVRYVAGLDINRQLRENDSEVSREALGLAHAAHATKVRNLGAAARDHLLAESETNGLRPDDIKELSDLDALTAAGYAVPVAPTAPVVDVTKHPDYIENARRIAQLEAADAAGKAGS